MLAWSLSEGGRSVPTAPEMKYSLTFCQIWGLKIFGVGGWILMSLNLVDRLAPENI